MRRREGEKKQEKLNVWGEHLYKMTFPSLQSVQGQDANKLIPLLAQGSSGTSESFHLHYEYSRQAGPINPAGLRSTTSVEIFLSFQIASRGETQEALIQRQVKTLG